MGVDLNRLRNDLGVFNHLFDVITDIDHRTWKPVIIFVLKSDISVQYVFSVNSIDIVDYDIKKSYNIRGENKVADMISDMKSKVRELKLDDIGI